MKKIFTLIAIFLLSITLVACDEENTGVTGETVEVTHKVTKIVDDKTSIVEVTETFKVNPKRVITYALGVADIFDYFGLEEFKIEAFGLPKSETTLPTSLSKFKDSKYADAGTLFIPNEGVLNFFNPDLIILDGRTAKLYDELKTKYPNANILDASLTTYVLADHERNIENLGKIFPDMNERLQEKIIEIKNEFTRIAEIAKDYRALFVIGAGKSMAAGKGKKGRFGVVHKEFGFKEADPAGVLESIHGGSEVSKEYVAEVNPEIIFFMDRNFATSGEASDMTIFDDSLLANVDAVENKRIYQLDSAAWYLVSGGFTSTFRMISDINQFISTVTE